MLSARWCETTCLFIYLKLLTVILSISCHPHPVLAKATFPDWTQKQRKGLDACDAVLLELIQCVSPHPPGFCLRVPHHPPGQFPLTEAPSIGQLRVSPLDLTGTPHEVDLLYRSEVLSVQELEQQHHRCRELFVNRLLCLQMCSGIVPGTLLCQCLLGDGGSGTLNPTAGFLYLFTLVDRPLDHELLLL